MVVFFTKIESWGLPLFYGIIILIAIFLYLRARKSRKTYQCPECGESFQVEHMSASMCKVCGTAVSISETKVSDKI